MSTLSARSLRVASAALLAASAVVALAPAALATAARVVTSPFHYDFRVAGTLEEAGNMDASWSPYWWLNSGGYFYLSSGTGKTVQGSLPAGNKWRLAYAAANPVDTDNGYHPQNIFRLVTRSKWQNFRQEIYAKINRDQPSSSPNREGHNGILLFNRYLDSQNLYYLGLRVDGAAVIKKKQASRYTTLAYKKILPGTYNRTSNPNLMPKNVWIGIRSETVNNSDGSVTIRLFTDIGRTGEWKLALETRDASSPIKGAGYAGLRTDFMDVEFDDFRATNL